MLTCAVDDKHDVEWTPTKYEHSHYNGHRQRDFTLLVQFRTTSFLLSPANLHKTHRSEFNKEKQSSAPSPGSYGIRIQDGSCSNDELPSMRITNLVLLGDEVLL